MTRETHSSFHAVKYLHKPPKACIGHQDRWAGKARAAPLPGLRMAEAYEGDIARASHGPEQSFWEQEWQCQAKRLLGWLTRFGFGKGWWCLMGHTGGQVQAEVDPSHTVGRWCSHVCLEDGFPKLFLNCFSQTRKNSG